MCRLPGTTDVTIGSGVIRLFSTIGVSCVSGVSSTGVSILSVSLLFSPLVFIRSLLNSGNKLEAQGRSSAENGSLVNRTCLRFLL